jgi:hypothetical protein
MRTWRDLEVAERKEAVEDKATREMAETAAHQLRTAKEDAEKLQVGVDAEEHAADLGILAVKGEVDRVRAVVASLNEAAIQDGGLIEKMKGTAASNLRIEEEFGADLQDTERAAGGALRREAQAERVIKDIDRQVVEMETKNSQLANAVHAVEQQESVLFDRAKAGGKISDEKLARVTRDTISLNAAMQAEMGEITSELSDDVADNAFKMKGGAVHTVAYTWVLALATAWGLGRQ